MATTADLHQLKRLAERHRWRVVAIGDPAQLPPVGRGGDFAHWTDHLPAHHLDTLRRFTEPWEAKASLPLRRGDPNAAKTYGDHCRLQALHPALVATRAADLHVRRANRGETVTITTNSTGTARQINREIQRRLHRWHLLRDPVRPADDTKACAGDTIATRRNDPGLRTDTGERIRNRHAWTVTTTHPDGALTVTDPQRGTVTLPAAYVARHVELGWAVTGYGAQGDTTDIGIAVLEPGTTRNHAYVALTRGRHENHALLPDPTGTANPAEQLQQMIEPPARHLSALSTREHLHHEAGMPIERPAIPPPEPDEISKIQARLDRLQTRSRSADRGLRRRSADLFSRPRRTRSRS